MSFRTKVNELFDRCYCSNAKPTITRKEQDSQREIIFTISCRVCNRQWHSSVRVNCLMTKEIMHSREAYTIRDLAYCWNTDNTRHYIAKILDKL